MTLGCGLAPPTLSQLLVPLGPRATLLHHLCIPSLPSEADPLLWSRMGFPATLPSLCFFSFRPSHRSPGSTVSPLYPMSPRGQVLGPGVAGAVCVPSTFLSCSGHCPLGEPAQELVRTELARPASRASAAGKATREPRHPACSAGHSPQGLCVREEVGPGEMWLVMWLVGPGTTPLLLVWP